MKTAPHRVNDSGAVAEQLSLLPEPDFRPIMPVRNSLGWRALMVLMQGKTLEQPDWLSQTRSWRLAATVKELDYLGWELVSIPVHRVGHQRPIARYALSQRAIRLGASMLAGATR